MDTIPTVSAIDSDSGKVLLNTLIEKFNQTLLRLEESNKETKSVLDKVLAENKQLKEEKESQSKAHEDYIKQQKQQETIIANEQIIEEAIKSGKVTPEKRTIWMDRLKENQNIKEIINELPINKSIVQQTKPITMPLNNSGIPIPSANPILSAIQQHSASAAIN